MHNQIIFKKRSIFWEWWKNNFCTNILNSLLLMASKSVNLFSKLLRYRQWLPFFIFICFEFHTLKCYSNLVRNKTWEFIALDCCRKQFFSMKDTGSVAFWRRGFYIFRFFLIFCCQKLYFNLYMTKCVTVGSAWAFFWTFLKKISKIWLCNAI